MRMRGFMKESIHNEGHQSSICKTLIEFLVYCVGQGVDENERLHEREHSQ